jgi:hypothetical protein
MLLVKVPWADRVMALPFLLLAPSKRFYADKTRATAGGGVSRRA